MGNIFVILVRLCKGLTDWKKIDISWRDRDTMKNVLGRTVFYTDPHRGRYCVIELNLKIGCTEAMKTGVLWHEVCHCIPWINEGRSDGHSSAFYRRLWSKPLCAFYSICAEFWFGLLDAFN